MRFCSWPSAAPTPRVSAWSTPRPASRSATFWVRQGGSTATAYTLKTDPSGTVQFQQSAKQYSLTRPGYEETQVELSGSVARIHSPSDPQGVEVKRYGEYVQVMLRRQNPADPAAAMAESKMQGDAKM